MFHNSDENCTEIICYEANIATANEGLLRKSVIGGVFKSLDNEINFLATVFFHTTQINNVEPSLICKSNSTIWYQISELSFIPIILIKLKSYNNNI